MTESTEKNYRETVLTPTTDFPMRAKLPEREPERLAKWEAMGLYEKVQRKNADKPTFIFHDGPPYANGDIHLGHALNKVLKDIIVRYRTMKGFRAPFVPGWDCHGLPIEQQVIKKLGSKLRDMEPVEVRRRCREYAEKYVGIQREQFKRLGIAAEWDRPYLTYDHQYEVGILSVLRDLVAKGLVTKGMKCVHWDPVFRTALAEAEIEHQPHVSDSIYVKFPIIDCAQYASLKGLDNVSLVIWTTTPWTLPANEGVCLHPTFDYVVLEAGADHYVVAKDLAEGFMSECSIEAKQVATLKAEELHRGTCKHPIFEGKTSLIIIGDHVTLEAGTGCVHTAPGHGADDFEIGRTYDLPITVPVDDAGRFTEEFADMQGVKVFAANPKIIERIDEAGILLGSKKIEHEYPHSWRSHKPIIFRATEQWFMELGVGDIRDRALKAIDEEVRWIPPWGRDRIHGMLESRPDWCLSRQRSWGVPIPSIRSKKSGESVLEPKLIEKLMAVVADKGSDAWYTEPLSTFWPEGFVHEPTGESSPEDFEKEFDILDVWFDSGASHVAVLEMDERLSSPADIYLEGSDQHRGWFQSSLLTSIGVRDRAPYRAVLTHGFTLDSDGRAMSKSRGIGIMPQDLMKQTGADILRLWVVNADYRSDMTASKEVITRTSEAYRRMRNALRFLIGNIEDFDIETDRVEPGALDEIDRWILSRLTDLIAQVDKAYDEYEFHKVYHLVYAFCNRELSAVYMDVVKDRLYCSARDDATRRAAQTTMVNLLETVTGLLAPILVFTTDEAWEFSPFTTESVHLTDFPAERPEWRDTDLDAKWARLLDLREAASLALEESRRAKSIGHSLDASVRFRPANAAEGEFIEENLALLKALLIVSDVELGEVVPGEAATIEIEPSDAPKCGRCWMRDSGLGADPEHPTLCPRCLDVVTRIEAL